MRSRTALGWSAAGGILSALAFDPWSVPLAMLLGLTCLALALHLTPDARPPAVAGIAVAFAVPFMFLSISWMRSLTWGGYLVLAAFEALLIGLTICGAWLLARLPGWPIWVAALWTAGEWLRGTFPFHGFPWARAAQSAIDTPFAPWARVVGLPTVSFLMMLVACLIVLAATTTLRWRIAAGVTAAAIVLAGLLLPTGLAQPADTRRVALIQGDTPGEFLRWPYRAIFDKHVAETENLSLEVLAGAVETPDLVIWPENATDVDLYTDAAARDQVEELSRDLGAPILVGGIFAGDEPMTSRNAGVVWDADGPGERYVKRRPVPFGEYVPFRDALDGLIPQFNRDIPRDMLPGEDPGVLHAGDLTLGVTICYDIAFDGVVRELVDGGAGVLVVQTSNAAFVGSAQPEQQWDISRMRAIETGREVLVASTNGVSGVIGADGEEIERAPGRRPATIQHQVRLASGTTLGVRLGPWLEGLWVLLASGSLGVVVLRRVRR